MSKKRMHLPSLAIPLPDMTTTLQSHLELTYPLPIGDLTADPLTHQPWWKFQMIYYHHLLQWHPDHPNAIDPVEVDPLLLTGMAAKLTLTIRELVLESQKGWNFDPKKGVPKEILDILPLIQSIISLDFLTCMYTIFLPIMGNTLPITTWNHLFDILQLILATMKIHTITESGTPNQHKIYKDPSFSPYNGIRITLRLSNLITKFGGTILKSDYRILIKIPSDIWNNYGRGYMNLETAHNFEQAAWIQICQLNAKDLEEAINQLTLYEELSHSNKIWQEYKDKNQHKITYIQLLYQCKVYSILEQWVMAETQRAHSIEHNIPNPSPYGNNATSKQTQTHVQFNEEWDAGFSSSDNEAV